MVMSPASETTYSKFVCDCGELFRSACAEEPFYKKHNGKRYCVFHFPVDGKSEDFKVALHRKLKSKDFNFRGVWFPDDPEFFDFEFGADAHFIGANFRAHVEFDRVTFSAGAYFNAATFGEGADFGQVAFNADANFTWATFGEAADFSYTDFSGEVDFTDTRFKAPVMFFGATFRDHVRFAGRGEERPIFSAALVDLQFARIDKPDHFSFHTLKASPCWFVNIDSREFQFYNVEWKWRTVKEEIRTLEEMDVSSPLRMLSIACRNLAVNAEENHRYEEASKFRYMAMDSRRLEHWGGFDFRRLGWWYWLASGYGERVVRALGVLIGILLLSAILYTQVGFTRWEPRLATESEAAAAKRDETGAPLKLSRALTYSAAVMTLQKPEPRPATTAAKTIVLLETILGPVQAALLALAIRRKFMR
jgi:hypothetical protein